MDLLPYAVHVVLLLIKKDGQVHVGVVQISACGYATPKIEHFRQRNEVPPLEIKSTPAEVVLMAWGLSIG